MAQWVIHKPVEDWLQVQMEEEKKKTCPVEGGEEDGEKDKSSSSSPPPSVETQPTALLTFRNSPPGPGFEPSSSGRGGCGCTPLRHKLPQENSVAR
ncbi:UNVERIFIED_CONTAM: hypothetical protein FKN15_016966 [Acipenser sinensis]